VISVSCVDLAVKVGDHLLIDGLDLDVRPGRFVGVVGPNGSGKSTLLKTIYRVTSPARGAVLLDGRNCHALAPRQVAQQLAVVAQETPTELELTVHEVVMLGRLPHQGVLARDSETDRDAVADAMRRTSIVELANRSWQTLSGGERQRVVLARALAQRPGVLILDEPTNHLDVRHQLELLTLARELGVTTIAALHDLNLASEFCDEVIVVNHGAIVAAGPPAEVFTSRVLEDVFDVQIDRIFHPRTGALRLLFSRNTQPGATPCNTEHRQSDSPSLQLLSSQPLHAEATRAT